MPTDVQTIPAGGSAAREIELKLHVEPADLARLAAAPLLRERAEAMEPARRLRTVYYDTPDLRLYGRGIALRVRHMDGRAVQGVKMVNGADPSDSIAIAVRREWEWPLAGEVPDLGLLDSEGIGALVPADMRGALAAVFETDFRRTSFHLHPDPMTAVEVALDEGEVTAGGRSLPICEVELELKSGRIGRLFELALDLQRVVPLRIGMENKAEAGFRLVTGRTPVPVLPEALALSPVTTAAEAFRHIVRHCLRQLLVNEPCALAGGDAEGLHQIRVALRRLRMALKLFQDVVPPPQVAHLKQDIRWLADRLQPAREWDVLVSCVLTPIGAERSEGRPEGFEALADAVRSARRKPAQAAAEAIAAPRCTGLMLALGAWLEDGRWHAGADAEARAQLNRPMAELAGPWLAAHHARVRKPGKPVESLNEEGREKLRRRLRRLRYAVDFFRGLYPAAAVRRHVDALEALLAALDAAHDAVVGRALLVGLAKDMDDPQGRKAAEAAIRWIDKQAERRRKALPDLWRALRDAPPFWGQA